MRWPCGTRSNYRFGYDGKFDIEVWSVANLDTFFPCSDTSSSLQAYLFIYLLFVCLFYSDPFSTAVIMAVRGTQCSDSDEKRCNDLKGWYLGVFNECIKIYLF